MGFLNRFKKDKKEEKKPKNIKSIDEIPQDQIDLKKIAMTSKDRNERAFAADNITNQYVSLDLAKNVTDRGAEIGRASCRERV